MRTRTAKLASVLLLASGAAVPAAAQLIPIRTVPVAQSHQFDIFPSRTLSMGGVSIAVADSLLDPFRNPALGARLSAPVVAGAPAIYSVSHGSGGGRTLPLGGLTRAGDWHGGLYLALQQVDLSDRFFFPPFGIVDVCPTCLTAGIELDREDRTQGNRYAFASVGRRLPDAGMAVGASVSWAGLNAVDGVDLLYAGSARVKQHGAMLDLRLGMLKELAGERSLEAVLVHNRYGMTHDVIYLDNLWEPVAQRVVFQPRVEQNLDRTNTWGLHLEYEHPLAADGWRLGWLGTANYKTHPKIPNYAIMNIPRDPGHSAAFNVGLGAARSRAGSTVGIEVLYEPIWSYTWADTETPVATNGGGTIPAGGRTVENWFRFSNAVLRMGIDEEIALAVPGSGLGLQLGLAVRSIRYHLEQRDNVRVSERTQDEQWTEWTPTWGLALRRPGVEIRYQGRVIHGTGRPGVRPAGGMRAVPDFGSNIVVAPSGPLTLDPVRVQSHQVSVAVPVR